MRRVVVYLLMSLDAGVERPDQWLLDFDADMYENLRQVIQRQDDVLLGRVMYQEWSEYWPTATDEPFASFINGVTKHVVTSDDAKLSWDNSTRINGDVVEYVKALKQSEGRDIGVHGSLTLAESLIRAGVVDELRLVVAPALAGSGRRLFNDDVPRNLKALSSKLSSSGSLLLAYDVLGAHD